MANTEKVRLNKYLSQAGICSRREADVLAWPTCCAPRQTEKRMS